MSKKNILVIEDEAIVSKDIQQSLKKLGYNIVGSAATGEKAVELAKKTNPDLVLMDIMLKGEMSGIDAAEQIRKDLNVPVIYLTAYADENTLAKAKVTEPYGYIIKPFKEVDLHTSIEMALYKYSKEREVIKERDFLYSLVENKDSERVIFVKSNSKLVKVETQNILFVEALKDYVVVNVGDIKYTIHSTMKEIEKKLPFQEFQRVHRSYIVRLDKITSIQQLNITIDGGKKLLPIGGSYKDDLYRKIKLV
jgi:DNA-binding LytR/AlgR family response regulator